MKRLAAVILAIVMLGLLCMQVEAAPTAQLEIKAPSAVLMDFTTGTVLYEKEPHEKRPLASVTKIMTMLLAMEQIDSGKLKLEDIITGSAHAKSYGGSTIFLEEGEQLSVRDILKGIAVASGNDAAVALGEHIGGSEADFVEMMNAKATQLGMKNTHFVNCNGLDADGHYSSAYDIALMSRELMKHPTIFQFTGIWMDSLRNGAFTLSNTNKLIRFYKGATGLKTGSTDKAGFCISATAKRDNLHLIAVIMAAPTSKERQADASALLNYGFSTYGVREAVKKGKEFGTVSVEKGVSHTVKVIAETDCNCLYKKSDGAKCELKYIAEKNKPAPIKKGDKAGVVEVSINGKKYTQIQAVYAANIKRISFPFMIQVLLKDWLC